MTNKQAKDLLDNLIGMVEDNQEHDYDTALKMGIKALDKEPCEDAVSRSTAKTRIYLKYINRPDICKAMFKILDGLPSVQPKLAECADAVSRQAVEEIINDIRDCISVEGYWAILERLKKLSSVQRTSNADKKHVENTLDDAISRQAALDIFTATKLKKFDFILYARAEIKKLPSVRPQEQTGRWIEREVRGDIALYCSECETGLDVHYHYLFCPNCGARMVDE